MGKAMKESQVDTTLEREWGRLRRGQLMGLVRASSAPGHSPLAVELLRAVVEAGEIRASDLASELFVTKTSISRYVNEMVRGVFSFSAAIRATDEPSCYESRPVGDVNSKSVKLDEVRCCVTSVRTGPRGTWPP